MDGVNFTDLLRHRSTDSLYKHDLESYSSSFAANGKPRSGVGSSQCKSFDENEKHDLASHTGNESEAIEVIMGRPALDAHTNLSNDTTSYFTFLRALQYPEVYMPIFYAARITLMVALPLGLLGRHPKVQNHFPAHVVIPLWGIVDCRYTVGEQIATTIVTCQTALFVMAWGTVNNSWSLLAHPSAWWCAVFFAVFAFSMFGDVRCKRLVVLMSVMILQMENLPGGTAMHYALNVGCDMFLSASFAFFQCLFPAKSVAKGCDEQMAGGWKHVGVIVRNAAKVCWSDDPIERAVALSRTSTMPLQNIFRDIPGKLFFVMYEFWESTLRLELRKERVDILKACIPRLHALTDCARALTMRRVYDTSKENSALASFTFGHRNGEHNALRYPTAASFEQPAECLKARETLEGEALPEKGNMNEEGDKEVRHREHAAVMWDRARDIARQPLENTLVALDSVLEQLGENLNPDATAQNVPFDDLRDAAAELGSALNKIHFDLLVQNETMVDAFHFSSTIFFHVTIIVLAEGLVEYGEGMKKFNRKRYKSQWTRIWEFFFYDYWSGFWEELPKRLTLATPRDVRMFKDAIKMACAYSVGVMFTEYADRENVYYFGMAILMGVGWPTAGDTMIASVYRITGMVCACSIAYIAVWHTPNLAGELAICIAGVFISLIFRDHPPYSHTAQYCSMLIITNLTSASQKMVMLSRIVSNCFTVMAYYAIVVFLFPIDVFKVAFTAEMGAIVEVTDRFSRLVDVISQPLNPNDTNQHDAILVELDHVKARGNIMWNKINAFGSWLPKVMGEPTTHGMSYPTAEMQNVLSSLRRLASATDIIVGGLYALHHVRYEGTVPQLRKMMSALAPVMRKVDVRSRIVMQDFIDALVMPYEWSPIVATQHFSEFLELNDDLHRSFFTVHWRHIKTLRNKFHKGVMARTFAAAASSNLMPPGSFTSFDAMRRNSDVKAASGAPTRRASNSNSSVMSPYLPLGPASQQSQQQRSTNPMVDTDDDVDKGNLSLTNDSIAHSIADTLRASFAFPSSSSPATAGAGVGTPYTAVAPLHADKNMIPKDNVNMKTPTKKMTLGSSDHPLAMGGEAAGEEKGPKADNHEPFTEQPRALLTSTLPDDLEDILRPMEKKAHKEEYEAFIKRRNPQFEMRPEDHTVSHDIHMVLSILVATDMFFAEAERLLKTMYSINVFARSRVRPPKEKKQQS